MKQKWFVMICAGILFGIITPVCIAATGSNNAKPALNKWQQEVLQRVLPLENTMHFSPGGNQCVNGKGYTWCYAFAREMLGVTRRYNRAIDAYHNLPGVKSTPVFDEIPIGAIVFWDANSHNAYLGHAAIKINNSEVMGQGSRGLNRGKECQVTRDNQNKIPGKILGYYAPSSGNPTSPVPAPAPIATPSPSLGKCPSGNGLYCGDSGKGQNTSHLYQCTNGSYSVKTTCNSGCQKNGAGKSDSCKVSSSPAPAPIATPSPSLGKCPSGNGLYCGDSGKGQNTSHLYQCTNGSYSVKTTCNSGCQKNGAGKSDSCKVSSSPAPAPIATPSPSPGKCPSGNGLYCGDSGKGQNTSHLYQCTNGSYSVKTTCNSGCQKNAAGKDDSCKVSSGSDSGSHSKPKKCPSGNGLYCGDDGLGQKKDTLYKCLNGDYDKVKKCSNGCRKNTAGKDDVCK